jgi:hypothetical protein
MSQREPDIVTNLPSNLLINSKVSELDDCKKSLLIFNTKDIKKTTIIENFESIKSRLDCLKKDTAKLRVEKTFILFR